MPIELTEEYVKNNAVPLGEAQPELTDEYVRANCVTEQEFRGGAPVFGRPQLRQAFLGSDPLAFETDPEQRKRLEATIALSANPEQSRKRAALAAYFSHGNRDETGFAYENIHSFIRMYHGREMSIDASFADIASMLSELPETTPAAPQKELEQQEQPGGVLSYLSGVGGAALWGWARYWNNTGLGLVDTALTAGDVLDRGIGSTVGATGKGLSDVWIEHQSEKLGIEGKTETERKNYRAKQMAFFRDAYLNAIRGELALVPEENQAKRQLLERKLAAVQSIYDARIRENNEAPSFQENYRQFQQEINRNLEQKLEEAQKKYHTGKTLGENWEAGDVGGLLAESVAVVTDQVALSVIPQTVSFALGGTALSMGTLVSSSMGDRINQVSELGWSPERVTASAMYYAAAEAIPEFFLGKIPILKRIFGDGVPKGKLVRGLWQNTANLGREMLSAGARDTAGELVTFIAEKFQDGVEGVNTPGGKLWWEMSADEVREFALEGLAETIVGSMGTAGPMGGVAAFREQRTLRAIDAEKHRALNRAEERRNELSAKEELTPEEQAEAVALDLVLDAANEEAAAQVVNQVDAARQEAAAPENREKIGSPIPEEELSLEEQAEAAANSLELYKTLRHNPLDTVARLREVMRLYRFDNVEIVDRPESFSQAALDAIARHGFSPSMVRGFYDSASDTVYFNAARLSPSEVPGVVFHELVAHKGLREVLAPEAFHSMLDSVSSRHGGEARFREIAERYHLDLGTENGRREAAEEYIAHLAEERNEALKPSWWREFLAQVKQLLRRLPYLDRVRWSDREIEALLRRSARAIRRRNRAGNNTESGTRNWLRFSSALTDDPEGGKAFPKRTASTYDEARNHLRSLQGKIFVNADSQDEAKLSLNGINKLLSNKAREKSNANGFTNAEHFEAISNIDRLYENAVLVERREDRKGSEHIRSIKRFAAPFYTGKTFAEAYITVKEIIEDGNRIYSLELDELKKPSAVNQGGSPDRIPRPADGTLPDTVADTTKQYPVAGSYNKLLDKTEKSRALLEKEEKKSKFSIIGEEGAAAAAEWYGRQDAEMWKMLGLDLSTQQGNAVRRLEDLSVAKQMAEASKVAETIKLATGWEKGADGKWRTETDDNWQFSPEFLRLEPYESLPIDLCIQEGTELFSAYPELREFNVRLSTSLEMQQSKGWFDREEHEFVLLQDGIPAMKKTLIHEIQHYIQEQEGFAPGGNLYTASRLAATGNYSSTELADAYRKFHDNVKLLPGDLYENIGRVLHEDSFRNFRNVLGEELGELWGSGETAIDFMRNAYDSSNRETFLHIYETELKKAEKGHPDAFSLYRRLAGEVEARNAEKRSGLSLEERLRTLLANTEDVAEQDKIYLEKNTADLPLSREEDSAAFQRWFADSKVVDATFENPVRFSVAPVWTGSAASYDAPSLQYIGTGEGAQVYGWGLYGSSSRNVGEWYARQDVKRKNRERILLDGKEPDLESMDKLERNVLLDILLRKGSISGTLEYYRLELKKPRNPHFYDDSAEIRSQMQWLEENQSRIQYIPENENVSGRRNLYRQTFWPGKEENLLDWDKPVPENQRRKIEEQLKTEGLFVDGDPDKASEEYRALKTRKNDGEPVSEEELSAAYEKAAHLHAQRNVIGTTINGDIPSGSMVYENLEDILGGPKAVSEFLYRAGIDGVTFVGGSSGVRNYVAFSDKDILVDEHIRFSESGQAEELANLMAKRVAPIIRDASGRDSDVREEVRTLLSQEGFDLSDAELEEIIKRAQQQVRRFRSLQRLTEENDYIRATDPWIATLQDVYSTNFKISTAGKYATEDFSGTWIGKDGGVAPDEAARTLSAAFGQEITDDDVVDHFRYLKRRDILARRREENRAMEEALREEERLHDMELAEQILAGEFPFDDEFIGANPRVAKMVRDMVSPAKPGEPRADWATVRAALGQENPQEFAKGYFEGREAGRQEYRERLREARKNTTDIRTLQEIATREVRRVLPEELQGAFLKRIAELGKFRTEPSPAYPQGRRAYELDKLIRDINSYEIRSRIIALADRYTAKRNYKGIPVSILENMQRELDEIRTVLRLSPEAVALKIAENSAAIEAQEAADASAEEIQKLQHENMVLSTFGNLDRKSPQELEQAMGALELVISTGKLRFATKLAQRQEQVAAMRLEALDDAGNQGKKARTLSGGIVTKQAGLRTLLDWVSLKSGKSFDESFSGKMMRRVEDATEEEKTRLRNMQKSFDRLLEQVGVKTLREKMEFFRELMRKEEKTGVHRLVYTSSRKFVNGEERLVNRRKAKRRLITPELARKLLADHDSGKAPMAYYTAEFLRLQLAAHDAGVKAEVNIMGTQEENDQIARYKLEAEGGKTLQLIEPTEEEFSHREELSLTRDAAMQIWLSWQQPDVRAGMEWNGWSESSIRELEKFLGERYLTLAKGLRSLIAAGRQELNARVEEFYGAGLPEKPNYFPAKHLESLGKEINSDTLLGSEYGRMSVSPGFLIARKFHLLDVDTDGTAIGSFLSNQMQAAHFLAFGRVIRDARAVYNDRDVRERITAEYGRDVFEQLIDRFDVLAKGGRKLTDAAHVLNSLYKVWVPSMIAVNASSATKQIAGVINYMNDIPAGAFFRGFADANTKSELFRRFIADNQVQEYIANRMEGGFDRDLSFLLNSTRNIENYNPLASAIIEYGTMPTRLADKWCTVRGGFAVFQYHYNEVLKRTGNEREAWDTAVRMWRRSTDETQQSGSLKDQNVYQSMGGLMRYLTVFMSAPIQMMNREFMAVNRMLAGTGERRAEARRELARVVLINHIVCPFLMEALTQFFRAGFDWDEYEFGSFLTSFLLGPFEGFVVFGKLIRALGDRLTGSGGWQQSFQALPMADSAIQSVSTLMKIAEFDEFDSDDWVRQIKAASDLTMTAGSLVPGGGLAAAVGGAVSSSVRELRRIFRIAETVK